MRVTSCLCCIHPTKWPQGRHVGQQQNAEQQQEVLLTQCSLSVCKLGTDPALSSSKRWFIGMSVQYSSFFQMAMGAAMAMEMAHTMGTRASMARMPTALRCGCTIS